MSPRSTSIDWRPALTLFQRGLADLEFAHASNDRHRARYALEQLIAVLEWASPMTWHQLYVETLGAIAEARAIVESSEV